MKMTAQNAEAEILRQVEYYFSDSNLPRDKFLLAKTEENESGFVDISVLLSFKRLKALGATKQKVADAATKSSLLAINDDCTKIRRTTPLPETSQFRNRAVFVKGWPVDSTEPSLEFVRELFSPSGEVLSIRMRRWIGDDGAKHFKGSVFVEMESAEAVERVVAEEYSVDVPDDNGAIVQKTLLVQPVEEYFESKKEESRQRSKRRKEKMGDKAGKDAPPAVKQETKVENEVSDTAKNGTEGSKDKEKTKDDEPERTLVPGLILKFEGFGADVSREDIKEAFEPHAEVSWVDFRRGDSEGHIRFANAEAAKTGRDVMVEQKMEFGGEIPRFTLLEGEAEQTYWKQVWEKKDQMIENSKKRRRDSVRGSGGRGNGKRFRGGRGKGGFRGRR